MAQPRGLRLDRSLSLGVVPPWIYPRVLNQWKFAKTEEPIHRERDRMADERRYATDDVQANGTHRPRGFSPRWFLPEEHVASFPQPQQTERIRIVSYQAGATDRVTVPDQTVGTQRDVRIHLIPPEPPITQTTLGHLIHGTKRTVGLQTVRALCSTAAHDPQSGISRLPIQEGHSGGG